MIAALASLAALFAAPGPTKAKILVFAAASTTGAIGEISEIYTSRGLGEVLTAFAGSSALARQIVAGAPADIYISASPEWMDYLADEHAIEPRSRHPLVANGLVLIAPADSRLSLHVEPGFPLAEGLDGGRLAIGDPDHVPAGIYAKAALIDLGVWPELVGHLALMADVRSVLALVERGEVAAGIVYATDAAISSQVRIIGTFPTESHPPISYPAAIVAGRDRPEVRRFFAFLTSAEAAAVFVRHGFKPVIEAVKRHDRPSLKERIGDLAPACGTHTVAIRFLSARRLVRREADASQVPLNDIGGAENRPLGRASRSLGGSNAVDNGSPSRARDLLPRERETRSYGYHMPEPDH